MSTTPSVDQTFLLPINQLLPGCRNLRACPELPDDVWIRLGLERVLHELPSGRGFLQEHAFRFPHCPPRSNYFESLKSPRRLKLVTELNQLLCKRIANDLPDPFSQYAELVDFDLYAGDGHWHGAAPHDAQIGLNMKSCG